MLGECSAGATTRERCEIVKSLERSADTYPWSYECGEDRYDSDDEIGDDEEEGETRLREIWDEEVEREEERGKGGPKDGGGTPPVRDFRVPRLSKVGIG